MGQAAEAKVTKTGRQDQTEGVCFTGLYSLRKGRKMRRCKVADCRAKTRLYFTMTARLDVKAEPVWMELKVPVCKEHKKGMEIHFPPGDNIPEEVRS